MTRIVSLNRLAAALLCAAFAAPAKAQDATILAAGDIADCRKASASENGASKVAALIETLPGTVLPLGDLAYNHGKPEEFETCYKPSWGRPGIKSRTRPTPGNHDYRTDRGAPYYDFFGAAAGPKGDGFYSYDLGRWHILSLNSNYYTNTNGDAPIPPGKERQLAWLRADLANHKEDRAKGRICTLAYFHHPRFSSGAHGSDEALSDLWAELQKAGVDVVLSAHEHNYETFRPMDAEGELDEAGGTRMFVVGTGGGDARPIRNPEPNSAALQNKILGVLKMTLHPTSYDWEFVSAAGSSFTDSGHGNCH
ncbi:MAG: metallophosphoesterase [Elusimicrobia bacterium]|nr:metallophosphoesterase [Elusimicrobiota bacterium]